MKFTRLFLIIFIKQKLKTMATKKAANSKKGSGRILSQPKVEKGLGPVERSVRPVKSTDPSPASTLGKKISIPETAQLFPHDQYISKSYGRGYTLTIGIGNDHTAELIIDKEAHEALMRGEKLIF